MKLWVEEPDQETDRRKMYSYAALLTTAFSSGQRAALMRFTLNKRKQLAHCRGIVGGGNFIKIDGSNNWRQRGGAGATLITGGLKDATFS
jgi:hypothetical protein